MNLHELALLLDKLREAFEFGLTASIKRDLSDLTAAFRELPDQSVREFLKSIRDKPKAAPARRGKAPPVNLDELVGRIQQVRTHPDPAAREQLERLIAGLKNDDLRQILQRFQIKPARKLQDNSNLVLQLLRGDSPPPATVAHSAAPAPAPTPTAPTATVPLTDAERREVDAAVALYERLRDTRGLTPADVRSEFLPVGNLPKRAIAEVARRLGYSTDGSAQQIFWRLLEHLENHKLAQMKGDMIRLGH